MENYTKHKILNAIRCEIHKNKNDLLKQHSELVDIKNTNT